MDMATDPYLVDVDGEANDDDLFGNHDAVEADNVGPRDEPHAPVVPGEALDDNVDLGEDLQVENAKIASFHAQMNLLPLTLKTTVPKGTFPIAAGAASVYELVALVNSTAGGRIDERSVYSRSITCTWTRLASQWPKERFSRVPKLTSRSWSRRIPWAKPCLLT